MNPKLKHQYANLIAKEINEEIEIKDIEKIDNAKKEIRNQLFNSYLQDYINKNKDKYHKSHAK